MSDLEKNLANLPKPKLSRRADFKIKLRIYLFLFAKNLKKPLAGLLTKNTLVGRVALTALLLIIALGTTAVYAASSDKLTLGDTLYPLKKVMENVEEQLTVGDSAKVDTLGKFSERRVKEALNLAQEELEDDATTENEAVSDNIEQSISEALENVNSAMEKTRQMENTQSAQKAKEAIKKKNESIIQYLEDISDIAEKHQAEEIFARANKAKEAINKYNKILSEDKDDESSDDLPIDTDNSVIENQPDRDGDRQDDDEENDSDNTDDNSQNNSNESERDSRSGRDRDD